MSNPCDTNILVGKKGQDWYSFFKFIVLGMLGALLLAVLFRGLKYSQQAAPVILQPTGLLNPGVVDVSGVSDAEIGNVHLEITDSSGTVICCENSDAKVVDGQWTIQTGALVAGEYIATAYSVAPDGTKHAPSAPFSLSIADIVVAIPTATAEPPMEEDDSDDDMAMLAAPTLNLVNDLAAPGAVTFSGTGTANSTVEVDLNGNSIGTTTVAANGEWRLRSDRLSSGAYTAVAYAVDENGDRLEASATSAWQVGDSDYASPSITLPAGEVDPDAVTVSGSGEPGTTVELLQDGNAIGRTVVAEDGRWSIDTTVSTYLTQFEAVGLMEDGSEIGRSAIATLAIAAASAPLTFSDTPQFGQFTAGADGESETTFSWSGTGEPGTTIQAFASGVVGPFATTTVDDDGAWSIDQSTIDLPPGTYDISARMKATDGVALASAIGGQVTVPALTGGGDEQSSIIRTIIGGTSPLDPITIIGFKEPGEAVEILIDGAVVGTISAEIDGQFTYTIKLAPGDHQISTRSANGQSQNQTFSILATGIGLAAGTIDFGSDNQFFVNGRGPANSTVEVAVDGVAVGRADVDAAGRFRFAASAEPGQHVVQIHLPGNGTATALSSLLTTFTIGDGAEVLTVGQISGQNNQVQFFGTAEPNQVVQIAIDGNLVDLVTTRADGSWDYGGTYADGAYTIQARIADQATGQIFIASAEKPFTVDGGQILGSNGGLLRVAFADEPEGGYQSSDRLDDDGFISNSPAIHIILDSSYSMRLNLNGDQRLDVTNFDARINIAKRTLQSAISGLPANIPLSLRAFGHIENTATSSCHTALEIAVQPLNRDNALAILGPIRPQFNTDTPLAESIMLASQDLASVRDREIVLVVLTDGEETCGGDLTGAVQGLINQGFKFRLVVVGLNINDAQVIGRFEQLAQLGNGRYYPANSAEGVNDAITDALLVKYTVFNAEGFNVASGNVGGKSIQLAPGLYTVKVEGSDPRTFTLEVKAGQTALALLE